MYKCPEACPNMNFNSSEMVDINTSLKSLQMSPWELIKYTNLSVYLARYNTKSMFSLRTQK